MNPTSQNKNYLKDVKKSMHKKIPPQKYGEIVFLIRKNPKMPVLPLDT